MVPVRNGKILRIALKTLALLTGLLIVIWVILWIYVSLNEEQLINKVSSVVGKETHSRVDIRKLSVSIIRTFPLLSLQLTDVAVQDSTYSHHHKHLLKAADVYLRLSIPGLISGNSPVGRVLIRNGEINIITDSLGTSNTYVFKRGKADVPGKKLSVPDVVLNNVAVHFEDPRRGKDYHGFFRTMKSSAKEKNGRVEIDMSIKMLVKNLAFNKKRGAYLSDKTVDGKLDLIYNRSSEELFIDNVKLDLDNHPFYINGKFSLDEEVTDFNLNIRTKNVLYSKATSFLPQRLRKKLDKYSVVEPVSFEVELFGKTKNNAMPVVTVNIDIRKSRVVTPNGMFDNCSFNGIFTNRVDSSKLADDVNSHLVLTDFSGRWEKILIKSKEIKISNLIEPFLQCDIRSDIDLPSLNNLAGSSTLQFLKGKTSVDIVFKGPVAGNDSVASNINGEIKFYNAAIKYLPRNLELSDCDGTLKFVNNDLLVNKLTSTIGDTKLEIKGSAENFLTMLHISPEKLILNWEIKSPKIQLADFKGFLSKPETKKSAKKNAKFGQVAARIDKMFADGDVYVSVLTPDMEYKTFKATDVKAKVVMTPVDIRLEQVAFKHAGGSMSVSGAMVNGVVNNPVSMKVSMHNMNIPVLFNAFNNFGQDAITSKNIKGNLSANIDFRTSITNQATLVTENNEGTVHFLLSNGELNDFEPLQEVSKKAFKKQDFRQIKFADLKNKLDVKGTTFIINPMDIRSTALNFSVEGVYDYKKGTDMSIKFPLRNLTKSQADTDLSDEGKTKKGVSLRLRAKTGDDGKLKVSWDPFRLAVRNKEDVKDSAELKN